MILLDKTADFNAFPVSNSNRFGLINLYLLPNSFDNFFAIGVFFSSGKINAITTEQSITIVLILSAIFNPSFVVNGDFGMF